MCPEPEPPGLSPRDLRSGRRIRPPAGVARRPSGRGASPKGRSIVAPRLPAAHALRAVSRLALSDHAVLADLAVTGARLAGSAARSLRVERVILRDVDLRGARLEGLLLADARLENCD